MFLLELLLSLIGIYDFAGSSPPKVPFQQLLNTCTNPEYSNSTQCQYFFSTYPWRIDDIKRVFTYLKYSFDDNNISFACNCLEERLIRLIGNPNFDLASLGERSFYSAVINRKETLAIAIWSQLEKYKDHSRDFYFYNDDPKFLYSDLQLFECRQSMPYIVRSERNILQLLKKMVAVQPDCLLQNNHTMEIALSNGGNRAMREFLVDHGLEIIPKHFQYQYLPREGFEWALLNYRYSNVLIKNSIRNGSEVVAIAIWEFLKQMNCIDLLFQICKNTVIDAVNSKKVELLKTMLRNCPDCVRSNGDTLLGIAINGDQGSLLMIQLLNLYGVEMPFSKLHKTQFHGYSGNLNRSLLHYQLSIPRVGLTVNIIYDYFMKAVKKNKKEICNKILAKNISGIADIHTECLVLDSL